MFNGLFNDLAPEQIASILSCFVCDERSNEMPKLTGELSGPLRTMQDMAKRIATVSKEAKIEIDEELYVQKFKPFMMDIVFEWCKGASFLQLCKMTDIFEGNFKDFFLPRACRSAVLEVDKLLLLLVDMNFFPIFVTCFVIFVNFVIFCQFCHFCHFSQSQFFVIFVTFCHFLSFFVI